MMTAGEGTGDRLDDLSVGVLSFRTHDTLLKSLETHRRAGLPDMVGEFFVFFNEMTDRDRALADAHGVTCKGNPANTGIYGGFRGIAEAATRRYVLVLENDISTITDHQTTRDCLESALADMASDAIPVFNMNSRTEPGQGFETMEKIRDSLGIQDPLVPRLEAYRPTLADVVRMRLKHGTFDRFRGAAVFTEREPDRAHPQAWRCLPSGNYVTDSRFRNWSNQAPLFERAFFLNTICGRVDSHPDPRTINGFQDIERALNRPWWRRQRFAMGHSGVGLFSHARLGGDATPKGL